MGLGDDPGPWAPSSERDLLERIESREVNDRGPARLGLEVDHLRGVFPVEEIDFQPQNRLYQALVLPPLLENLFPPALDLGVAPDPLVVEGGGPAEGEIGGAGPGFLVLG